MNGRALNTTPPEVLMYPTLGQVIRRRRTDLGKSQGEVAEVVGYGWQQKDVSILERGGKRFPEPHILHGLANALECSTDALLREIGYLKESEGVDDLDGVEMYTHMMDLVDRARVPDHVKDIIRSTIRSARIIESERLNSKGTSPNTTE